MGIVLGAAYRMALRATAMGARLLSALPFAPAGWRAHRDRLGILQGAERSVLRAAPVIWLHAASVGELNAARPLLARLKERFPERLYLVSTTTRTGLALARELPQAHLAVLLPLDAPGVIRKFLAQLRLDAFFFTETEIWPTLLQELAAARVPALMVSGRVRPKTFLRSLFLRPIYRRALRDVTCCMQTEADAAGIIALGADPRRVVVTGSLKYDAATSDAPDGVARLARALGPQRPCVVAGSTHDGEEAALLDALDRLRGVTPAVVLVLAPRHPERLAAVADAITARGLALVRYSAVMAGEVASPVPDGTVVLLDVIGPLAHCYALATVAFVGGTLVPIGGHNLLEPARAGTAIVVGPHTAGVADVLDRLLAQDAAVQADSPAALTARLAALLQNPARAHAMGERARMVATSGQGSLDRHMKVVAARLAFASRERPEVI